MLPTATRPAPCLEAAGVICVEENGQGPGVRLRKVGADPDDTRPAGPATDAVERMDAEIAKDRARRKD